MQDNGAYSDLNHRSAFVVAIAVCGCNDIPCTGTVKFWDPRSSQCVNTLWHPADEVPATASRHGPSLR